MATPPGDGPGRRPAGARSIVWLHYLFAVLTLAVLGASVWLTHSLAEAYHEALEEYREWEGYDERVGQLSDRLSTIEAAVTEIEEGHTHSARSDDKRLEFADLLAEYEGLRSDFHAEAAWGHQTILRILAKLKEAEKASVLMHRAAMATVSAAHTGDDGALHAQMAAMERAERIARRKLTELHGIVQETQDLWWSRHINELGDTSESQLGIAFALLLVVGLGTLVGHRLQSRFARVAEGLRVAETQRAAEAKRFKDFATIASDWLFETDAAGRLTYVSSGIEGVGIKASDLVGHHFLRGVAREADQSGALDTTIERLNAGLSVENVLVPYRVSEEAVRWISTSAQPQFEPDGAFAGYRGVSRDHTSLVEAQTKLRASTTRYESLSESIDGIVYRLRLDERWTVEYLSPNTERFFGVPAEQLVGQPAREIFWWIVHRNDRERHAELMSSAVAQRAPYEVEFRIKSPFGGYKYMLERGRVIDGGPGEAPILDGFMVDITEQVRAREALRESERRFQSLSSHLDGALYRSRAQAPFTDLYFSDGVQKLTGYSASELTGEIERYFAEVVLPEDRAAAAETFARAKNERVAVEVEYRIRHKDGTIKWIYDRGAPSEIDAEGRPQYIDGILIDITARKEAEARAAEAERRFRTLLENIDEVFFTCVADAHWTALFVSPAFERLSGYSIDELLVQKSVTLADLVHPDDRAHVAEVAAAAKGAGYEVRYRLVTKSGAVRTVFERGRRTGETDDGRAIVAGVIYDITAQLEAQEALRISEDRFQVMASNFDGAIFRVRLDYPIVIEYVSSGIERLVGAKAETLYGEPAIMLNLIHKDDQPAYLEKLAAALVPGAVYEAEYRVTLEDGTVKWMLERGRTSVRDGDGKPTHVDGFIVDITARKAMEAELEATTNKVRNLIECIEEVFFTCRLDRDWTMQFISPSVERLSGYPAAEFLNNTVRSFGSLVHPEDLDAGWEKIRASIENGTAYEIEYRIIRRDGQVRWVFERGRPSGNTDGDVPVIHGYIADITERKEAEKALAAARDAAEAASKAKSEFLAMMSHEIRTPMNGVLGMTGVLLDTNLDPEQRRSAATIRESAESLLSIINDVLDFSKLEAQAMEFERVAFDLHSLLAYTSEIVAPRANAKAVALKVDVEADVPRHVFADPGRIRQVVLNLLGNAVKFTARGSVTLKAAMIGEGRLRVSVADTGIGIPADRVDRLFQSFSQTDASISRRFGGTGLGLAISKKLCERMGGTIGVESAVGQGSTFWFDLPVERASAAEAEAPGGDIEAALVEDALATISGLGRPLRLLVAEDNATNQLVAKSVLAKFGITPDFVGNGIEAIDAVRHRPYDIVLMDVHMPEMDGLDATKAIRSLKSAQASIPIVALTANAFANDIEQCRAAGMNGHVGKPFRKEELIVALARALKGGSGFANADRKSLPPAGGEQPVFDPAVIEKFRADSGKEMLLLLIDTFVSDAVQKLDRLATLAQRGVADGEAVRLAHSLKSAGAMAGAAALSGAAARLEKMLGADGAVAQARDVQQLRAAFDGYRQEVTARGLVANG